MELPARLSIAHSTDWHARLVAGIEAKTPLVLDGSRVEEIDTAILQLLVSAWLGASKLGIECRWQGESEALRHAATLIGVAATLRLDGAAAQSEAQAVG